MMTFSIGDAELSGCAHSVQTQKRACAARGVLTQEVPMHEGSITIRLPVDPKEIEHLNRVVRQFGDLHEVPGRTLYAVNLALDEVVTNAIIHGFDDATGQFVEARLTVREGFITAEVEDGGRAFNPLDAPTPDLTAAL